MGAKTALILSLMLMALFMSAAGQQTAGEWNNKGVDLARQGKYDEAIQAYDKAIQINPEYANAWYNKGNALYYQGKYDEAIAAYDKAIEIDPEYAEAWSNKGNALAQLGNYDEAIQAFDKAIQINPEYANAWNSKGLALYSQGKYEEALQACNESLEINPQTQNNQTWYIKGLAFKELGLIEEANIAFLKSGNRELVSPVLDESGEPKVIYLPDLEHSKFVPVAKLRYEG